EERQLRYSKRLEVELETKKYEADGFSVFREPVVYMPKTKVKYSPYGSRLEFGNSFSAKKVLENQKEIKNSPDFYQQAPFLTIAEDLLKLIKEDKVDRLIFLSAYDKRKFPNGDDRKIKIFGETFGKVVGGSTDNNEDTAEGLLCAMKLIPFESENKGQSKAE
ncbi:1370_t:CDS:2, partial [Funneliformis geosporum]